LYERDSPKAGIYGSRIADHNTGIKPQVRFLGTFPENVGATRSLLADSIEHKISVNYTNYDKGRLILLAYEVALSVDPGESQAIEQARELLKNKRHPFDEVWYLFPYASDDLDHLRRIWPC